MKRKYFAEFVYGATDGTVTTFAIISGVMGASLSPAIILILGLSNVLADGFSMASSNYLSEKSNVGSEKKPVASALVTFSSFVSIGLIPLLPFIAAIWFDLSTNTQFTWSMAMTFIAFLIIGFLRGIVSGTQKILMAVETVLIGGFAASIAFIVGYLLKGVAGM